MHFNCCRNTLLSAIILSISSSSLQVVPTLSLKTLFTHKIVELAETKLYRLSTLHEERNFNSRNIGSDPINIHQERDLPNSLTVNCEDTDISTSLLCPFLCCVSSSSTPLPHLVLKPSNTTNKMTITSIRRPIGSPTMAMAATSASLSNPTLQSAHKLSKSHPTITFNSNLKLPTTQLTKFPIKHLSTSSTRVVPLCAATTPSSTPDTTTTTTFHGVCYVLGDNIDTDQIIPAEYLTLVPSKPDEYRKLGSFALIGLPSTYSTRFIEAGEFNSKYSIVIGGENFGCGSSREHAPVALGAAGVKAVVAESYARIFFRNSVATGEVYPLESEGRLCDECSTGDVVTVELGENLLINHTTGKEYKLKPIGDAGPVIDAGGIFAYARKTGMIPSAPPA